MTIVRGETKQKALNKTIVLGTLALIAVLSLGFVIKAAASKPLDLSAEQAKSLVTINDIRSEKGLNALQWDEKLAEAANFKASDIIRRGYFDHVAPTGEMIWGTIEKDGYSYRAAGENLAIDFNNINDAYEAWLKSPSHLENIISSKYTDFGFGVAEGEFNGKQTKVYVQIFASKEPIYEQVFSNIGGNNG